MPFHITFESELMPEIKKKFNYTGSINEYYVFEILQRAFDSSDKFTFVDKYYDDTSVAFGEVYIEYVYITPCGKVNIHFESDYFDEFLIYVENDYFELWNLIFDAVNNLFGRKLNYERTLYDEPFNDILGRINISWSE